MMDPRSELLQKLKRQRRRMGEMCSPLKEIGNELPRSQPEVDSKGRVRQRAMCFEGAENCAGGSARPGIAGQAQRRFPREDADPDHR